MRIFFFLFVLVSLFFSCKNDSAQANATLVSEKLPSESISKPSAELYAKLDRLRVRADSSLSSSTVITISEGDTLSYLGECSKSRLILKLRGQNEYEPWLKVRHVPSQKIGWVYGGAVKFDSPEQYELIQQQAPENKELSADDLEWGGTVPTGWGTASIENAKDFKIFIIKFKEMVKNGDQVALSNLIEYPIKNVSNRQTFQNSYDRIFTDSLVTKVLAQRLDRIYRNARGAHIAGGDIIFKQFGKAYKIVSINFKGREDIVKDLMKELSGVYSALGNGLTYSMRVFNIKQFLEVTLMTNGKQEKLGRYLYESSQNGEHYFYQDGQSLQKRKLVFVNHNNQIKLKIEGSLNDWMNQLEFEK